jgi:hypothetical protein
VSHQVNRGTAWRAAFPARCQRAELTQPGTRISAMREAFDMIERRPALKPSAPIMN